LKEVKTISQPTTEKQQEVLMKSMHVAPVHIAEPSNQHEIHNYRLYRICEVANILGCSTKSVYDLVYKYKLPVMEIDKSQKDKISYGGMKRANLRIMGEDLKKWLYSRKRRNY